MNIFIKMSRNISNNQSLRIMSAQVKSCYTFFLWNWTVSRKKSWFLFKRGWIPPEFYHKIRCGYQIKIYLFTWTIGFRTSGALIYQRFTVKKGCQCKYAASELLYLPSTVSIWKVPKGSNNQRLKARRAGRIRENFDKKNWN